MNDHVPNKKRDIAQKAEVAFKKCFNGFTSGNLSALVEICKSMCVLKEFYLSNHSRSDKGHVITYLDKVFEKDVVLILSNGARRFAYTRDNLSKFIGTEAILCDREHQDEKRAALHNFAFDVSKEYFCEFGITANWIAGPNPLHKGRSFDREDAFVHEINLGRGRLQLTFVESVVFHTAYEFWQTYTEQTPNWLPKCRIPFNPDDCSSMWGKDLVANIRDQEAYWVQNISSMLDNADAAQ